PGGRVARGRLCGGSGKRHEGLARRGRLHRLPEGRPARHPAPRPARGPVRPRLPHQERGRDLRKGFRRGLNDLEALFDLGYHTKNVDVIFARRPHDVPAAPSPEPRPRRSEICGRLCARRAGADSRRVRETDGGTDQRDHGDLPALVPELLGRGRAAGQNPDGGPARRGGGPQGTGRRPDPAQRQAVRLHLFQLRHGVRLQQRRTARQPSDAPGDRLPDGRGIRRLRPSADRVPARPVSTARRSARRRLAERGTILRPPAQRLLAADGGLARHTVGRPALCSQAGGPPDAWRRAVGRDRLG
uniref:SAM-dependent methyltransferase n=1 Tax=Parastrongyloides trichosuri TaxID=131310 RepID=A0A0N5A4E3_PARTI